MRVKTVVGASHAGGVRVLNEDAVLRLPKVPLYVVVDGMGGPGVGDVAASIALGVVRRHAALLREQTLKVAQRRSTANRLALGRVIDQVFNVANREIQHKANQQADASMGCSMVLATVVDRYAYVAHVGDCRAYLVRGQSFQRLTEDHSLAELRLRRGKITRQQYETSPDRHVLYQCLGFGLDIDVDLAEVRLAGKDVLVLCSDGLVRVMDDEAIVASIAHEQLGQSLDTLIDTAVAQSAQDNVSAVLVQMESDTDAMPRESIAETLRQVVLLEGMTRQELLMIAPYLEEEVWSAGEPILTEGEEAEGFYVVVSGSVDRQRYGTTVETIYAGGHFGDLVSGRSSPQQVSAIASKEVRLFVLTREAFLELAKNKPDLGVRLSMALLDVMGIRARDLSERLYAVQRAMRGLRASA